MNNGPQLLMIEPVGLSPPHQSQQFQTAYVMLITQRSWLMAAASWKCCVGKQHLPTKYFWIPEKKYCALQQWPWPNWLRQVASSMVSILQVFSHSCIAPKHDVNSVFFPLEDNSNHYTCFYFLWVWMSTAHIEEERMKPRRGIGRWNPTFLLISDWSTGKIGLMLSLPSSKCNELYYTHNPRVRTGNKSIWNFVSEKSPQIWNHQYFHTVFSIYFYERVFES